MRSLQCELPAAVLVCREALDFLVDCYLLLIFSTFILLVQLVKA